MFEERKLTEEEKVAAGVFASAKYLPENHGAHVYAKDVVANKDQYIGKKFYCVSDRDPKQFAVVTLVDAVQEANCVAETVHFEEIPYKVLTTDAERYKVGTTEVVKSHFVTLYAY